MIRSSSMYSICTHRPNFDEDDYWLAIANLKKKVEKAKFGMPFNPEHLELYKTTKGMMTDAKKVEALREAKHRAEFDPLPDGAKTHLEGVWLSNNMNFHDLSVNEAAFAIANGNLCEDDAIELLGTRYGKKMIKNQERKTLGFLTGECDIYYDNIIRDTKVPETWKTFRNKLKMPLVYKWQLIAYCHLYNCNQAYLDYVLMPCPSQLIPMFTKGFNEEELEKFNQTQATIISLSPEKRVKTFKLDTAYLHEDVEFMLSRIEKAEEYYESLTYEKCMKMVG